MFGLGMPEIALIAVIGLVVFGPGKLPEVGKSLGRGIGELRNAINDPNPEPKKVVAEATTTPTTETVQKTATEK